MAELNPTPNSLEESISNLKPGQAIHVGHSSVIANFSGLRVGLDLVSVDGKVPAPFSNLTLSSNRTIPFLIPLVDTQSLLARPGVIAKHLDVLLYSHMHSDHFSLKYIALAKSANKRLRVICPEFTKVYLLHSSKKLASNIFGEAAKKLFLGNALAGMNDAAQEFQSELDNHSVNRAKLIESIEELSPGQLLEFASKRIQISSFYVTHPPYQLYLRHAYENSACPPALGYRISYTQEKKQKTALLVGESATDPELLSTVFENRENLSIIFFPTTEQLAPRKLKFLEEMFAHSSARALALVERIVKEKTIIVPLHQGLWYFQLTKQHMESARRELNKLASKVKVPLPFVSLTKALQEVTKDAATNGRSFTKIIRTIRRRWKEFRRIVSPAADLPINGQVIIAPIGHVIDFGQEKLDSEIKKLPSFPAIQNALNAHIAEYHGLVKEIESGWEIQKSLINYSLLVITGLIAAFNYFPEAHLLILLASLILSAFSLATIEQSMRMTTVGRYFKNELNPRINALLLEIDDLRPDDVAGKKLSVWNWEEFFRGGNLRTAIMGLSGFGKFSFAIFPGWVTAFAFYFSKNCSLDLISTQVCVPTAWTLFEMIAFAVAIMMGSLPILIGLWNLRYSFSSNE